MTHKNLSQKQTHRPTGGCQSGTGGQGEWKGASRYKLFI